MLEQIASLLDGLHALSAWSAEALWLPLAAWTLVALAAEAALRLWPPHSLAGYRARQALLFALPLGLAGAAATDWTLPFLPAAPSASAASVPVAAAPVAASVSSSPAATLPPLAWTHALGALTLAALLVAAWRLARLGASAARLVRLRRRLSEDVSADARRTARDVAERLGLQRRFRLARAPEGTAPMTLGAVRPTVALPPGLSPEEQRMALAHELVHLRRRDDRAAWAEALVGALFFAHPFCAVLRRRIGALREEACDAAVLAAGRFSPRRYAQMLLDVAAPSRAPLALSLAAPLHSLKQRLDAMKDASAPAPQFALFLAAALLAPALGLMACADLSAPTETTPVVKEPPPPPVPLESPLPDSLLTQSIASIDVRKEDGEPEIYIRFKPGTPEEYKERIRQHIEQRKDTARVTFGGEADWRSDHEEIMEQPSEELETPLPPLKKRFSSTIQSIEVYKRGPGNGELRIILKPGTPETAREEILKQLSERHDGLKVTVEIPDTAARDTTDLADVDERPEIIGGPQALQNAVSYPQAARADSLEGTVFVQFIVDEQGGARDLEVLSSAGEPLSREAIRAVRSLSFHPAKKDGEAVAVRMKLPVRFAL